MTNQYERVISLPWPDTCLRQNARNHWRDVRKATREARNAAWAVAMEAPRVETIPNAYIAVEYWPAHHRMDVQNVHAMMKPYIDGIADAMGCDDRKFNVNFPGVYAGHSKPGKVLFRVKYPLAVIPVRGVVE